MTQAQLAKETESADATISRIERGRFLPGRELLLRLSSALGVAMDELATQRVAPKTKLKPAETRLLAAVRGLDDAAIDDVARAVRLLRAAITRAEKPTR